MIHAFLEKARKVTALLGEPEWRWGLRFGVAAAVEHRHVLAGLGCRTIVDIGANRGQFSLVSRACFPNANLIAFEPLEKPANVYEMLFAGDARVALKRCAIGPESGAAKMHLSARDDSSSLLAITERQVAAFPGTGEVGRVEISVRRLNEFLSTEDLVGPALLKIDVQGYEAQALDGCAELLPQFDYVYVECSFVELYAGQALVGQIADWLRERGFSIRLVNNLQYDRANRPVQGDFLFARRGDGEKIPFGGHA